jgi:hypothetical protein
VLNHCYVVNHGCNLNHHVLLVPAGEEGLPTAAPPPNGLSPFAPMSISLSSQSSATNAKAIVESYLLKRRRGVLGPPVGKASWLLHV